MKQTLKLSLVAFTASASLLIMPAARADDCCKQTVTTINNIYSYLTDNIGKKYLKPLVTTELSYGTETKSNSVAAKAPEWVNEDAVPTHTTWLGFIMSAPGGAPQPLSIHARIMVTVKTVLRSCQLIGVVTG